MKKEFFLSRLKNVPKHIWILVFVVAVGIFLRTYQFHNWLAFNPDQARDATVISRVIEGKDSLPLLGTIAGGTNFHLGPMFYYFQYAAALIFGNAPDKVAYPDLFFSILAIGFLYLFLRKYFSQKMSLALTALMSVSYFAVINSRFAWNPNSIPFFVLLFLWSLLEMLDVRNKEKYRWPLLAGVALGVGVQLHTLLLLILPVVTAMVLLYSLRKKEASWKSVAIIFLMAIFLNVPQIFSEIKTGGANMQAFFAGSSTQTNGSNEMGSNVLSIASCQIEFNMNMVSSFENKEQCSDIFSTDKATIKKYVEVPGNFSDDTLFLLSAVAALLFSLGGYFLLIRYFLREEDSVKKNFLGLALLFNGVSFFALIPVASHITMRYFIILFFVPFVLAGIWGKFLLEHFKKEGKSCGWLLWGMLLAANMFVVFEAAVPYAQGTVNSADLSILGETQLMANYVQADMVTNKVAYIAGEKFYVKRYFPALKYLADKENLQLSELKNDNADQKIDPQQNLIFYIANTGATAYQTGDTLDNCTIGSFQKFNSITIFNLKNCQK